MTSIEQSSFTHEDNQMTQTLLKFTTTSAVHDQSQYNLGFKKTLFEVEDCEDRASTMFDLSDESTKTICRIQSSDEEDEIDSSKMATQKLIKSISKRSSMKKERKGTLCSGPILSTSVSINLIDSVKSLHQIKEQPIPSRPILSESAARLIAEIKTKKQSSTLLPAKNMKVNAILNSTSLKDRYRQLLKSKVAQSNKETEMISEANNTQMQIEPSCKLTGMIKEALTQKQAELNENKSNLFSSLICEKGIHNQTKESLKKYRDLINEQFENKNVSNIFKLNLIESICKSTRCSLSLAERILADIIQAYPGWLTEVNSSLLGSIIRINFAVSFNN